MSSHNHRLSPRTATGLYHSAPMTQEVLTTVSFASHVDSTAPSPDAAAQLTRGPQWRNDFSMEEMMASGTYFFRSCPTCGRQLNVRVELLGREIECAQCHAVFTATEEPEVSPDDVRIEQILARAQRYIESVQAFNSAAAE